MNSNCEKIEKEKDCPLCHVCHTQNERILLETANLRVIVVENEPLTPIFCRVIWKAHVAEMTDLPLEKRHEIMEMVYRVESALRQVFQPTKINLASLGNMVPHLHWHIIARFEDDAHFPAPIWANPVREKNFVFPENAWQRVQTLITDAKII